MLAFAFVTCLPLLYVLANSFSSAKMVNKGAVFLIPREFTLENYAKILSNNAILTGFRNTLFYVFRERSYSWCFNSPRHIRSPAGI